jgi:aryl-alcohol dehydrogenase-like predicted oxidoreductase
MTKTDSYLPFQTSGLFFPRVKAKLPIPMPGIIGFKKGISAMIPRRKLGKTGVEVSCIGLGGEGILRSWGREREARAVIDRALDLGINYMETARAYAGSESYYGLSLGSRRNRIFLASKAHDRTAAGALEQLEESLRTLKTDWLDLWQIHDVRTDEDLQQIFGPNGILEAFRRAKKDGKVRFIGITGHQDPEILLQALTLYSFDTVLLPVNPAEPTWLSFPHTVLPEARRQEMGTIGMKIFCRGFGLQIPGQGSSSHWLRYALSYDLSTVVIGCDSPFQVEENFTAAKLPPLGSEERLALEKAVEPWAKRLMPYKNRKPRKSVPKPVRFRPLKNDCP